MKTKIPMTIILGSLLASCSMMHLQTNVSGNYYLPTIAENTEVYSTEKAQKTYFVIGEVVACVDAFGDGSASVNY